VTQSLPNNGPHSRETTPPHLAVILVNFNAGALLLRCLESLRRECSPLSRDNRLVDNASTDGSADQVPRRFPEVRLIRLEKNLGFAGGVGRAVREATAPILILLNPDAEVFPDTLGELAGALDADPTVAVAGCKIYEPDGRTLQHAGAVVHSNLTTAHFGRGEPDTGQYNQPIDTDYVTGAVLAVRARVYRRLGGLDPGYHPGYYEETELCLRARQTGYRVVYIPTARALHHESASSGRLSRRFFYNYHKNRLRFLLRNYPPAYWLRHFAPAEWQWLRRGLPADQAVPLFRAYLVSLLRFPLILGGRRRQS